MKTKKLGKKLVLNKKTISHLNPNEASVVRGGQLTTTEYETCLTCLSCEPNCYTQLSYCFTQCVTNCVYQTKMCCLSNGCTYPASLCSCPAGCESVTTCI